MVSSKLKFNKEAQPVQGYLMKNSEGFEEGVVEGLINHLIRKAQDPANLSRGGAAPGLKPPHSPVPCELNKIKLNFFSCDVACL